MGLDDPVLIHPPLIRGDDVMEPDHPVFRPQHHQINDGLDIQLRMYQCVIVGETKHGSSGLVLRPFPPLRRRTHSSNQRGTGDRPPRLGHGVLDVHPYLGLAIGDTQEDLHGLHPIIKPLIMPAMIGVQLQGGLGNQCFQLAAARALAARHNTGVLLDLSELPKTPKPHCVYSLNAFNLDYDGQGLDFGTIDGPLYVEKSLRYDPDLLSQPDGTTLVGYFQSWRYIDPIKNILLRELTLTRPRSDTYKAYAAQILETPNSVAVHFRRRDAVDGSPGAKFHGTPDLMYYVRACQIIERDFPHPRWFLFSDDISWLKDTFSGHGVMHIIEGCAPAEDLSLMSLCRHAIIANSSFSFWGAWLGPHQRNGIVIAPQRWYLNEEAQSQTSDLCPPSWIRL